MCQTVQWHGARRQMTQTQKNDNGNFLQMKLSFRSILYPYRLNIYEARLFMAAMFFFFYAHLMSLYLHIP